QRRGCAWVGRSARTHVRGYVIRLEILPFRESWSLVTSAATVLHLNQDPPARPHRGGASTPPCPRQLPELRRASSEILPVDARRSQPWSHRGSARGRSRCP